MSSFNHQSEQFVFLGLQAVLADLSYPVAILDSKRTVRFSNRLFDSLPQKKKLVLWVDSLLHSRDQLRFQDTASPQNGAATFDLPIDCFFDSYRLVIRRFGGDNDFNQRGINRNDNDCKDNDSNQSDGYGFILSVHSGTSPNSLPPFQGNGADWEKLRQLASTDSLTGLFNRYALEQAILSFASIEKKGCGTFLLCDLDHFKEINDQYGHDMGDRVLVLFAEKLKKMFRSQDVVARLGGDEFAIFCPFCDAAIVEERMKNFASPFVLELFSEEAHSSLTISVALSYGIASFQSNFTLSEAVRRTDPLLFQMKRVK